jgi:hypothetical protein
MRAISTSDLERVQGGGDAGSEPSAGEFVKGWVAPGLAGYVTTFPCAWAAFKATPGSVKVKAVAAVGADIVCDIGTMAGAVYSNSLTTAINKGLSSLQLPGDSADLVMMGP